jgi:putative spermidine/putrescine transport system permease protein
VVGFWVSYYLVFHVRSILWQIGLFLLCTVPFWTSNIIRMISWIPLLGKEGLVNSALMDAGIVNAPLTGLLYSDFSVILAYVHLYTLFMIVPIFNTMARIDPALIEAAVDGGAKPWQVIWRVILPLSKTGIALGSIFVVAVVMGDFFVVRTMSGGQSGSVVSGMMNQISLLQYPVAAAGSVILLIVVTLMIMAVFAVVDVRREMAVR